MIGVACGAARLLLALALCGATGLGHGAQPAPDPANVPKAAASRPAEPPVATPQPDVGAMPAAGPAAQPCGAQAARYGDDKGFDLAVVRAGEVRIENPLRPLTPEVSTVLQVVINGKVATAYGPDVSELRRGGPPSTVEAALGGPIRWQAALPTLPDPLAIVAEDGRVLVSLGFRTCEAPPAVQAAPQARKGPARDGKGTGKGTGADRDGAARRKTPPGFSMPQGAIAE